MACTVERMFGNQGLGLQLSSHGIFGKRCLIFLIARSTTVFSHSQSVVVCSSCSAVLCTPTGGKARLTEGESGVLVCTCSRAL